MTAQRIGVRSMAFGTPMAEICWFTLPVKIIRRGIALRCPGKLGRRPASYRPTHHIVVMCGSKEAAMYNLSDRILTFQ